MDESAIWEKNAPQQENCTRLSRLLCKCKFSPKLHSGPWDYLLIKRSLPYNLKVDPVQFQMNLCNFKSTCAISSLPVQFQNNCTIPAYGF